jgi:orotidine-5'-phosphate decarboxylase
VVPAKPDRAKLIVALDFPRLGPALRMARRLRGRVSLFKIGKELFTAEGPRAVRAIARTGAGVFLDLKFHDIPNTVAGAVAAAAQLPGVRLLNVHALGGEAMLRAARKALGRSRRRPRLLAVTVLTSLDRAALRAVGLSGSPRTRAVVLARLAKRAGSDGVVASPEEIRAIRRACGEKFLIVVPGIRPAGASRGDQRRTATPAAAIRAGADYLVVGRPITRARDPRRVAEEVLSEIAAARRG